MSIIKGGGGSPGLKIWFRKDQSVADYIPLTPNPDQPPPVIPVTGAGDMFQAIYDKNLNGRADRVDYVEISEVNNLQDVINDLYNQGGGDGGKEIVTVTNNGGDTFKPGQPVAQNNTMYVSGRSVPPRHRILGLALEDSAPGEQLKIQLSGYIRLPTVVWDEVTDSIGGLAIDGKYFVNSNGMLSTTAPSNAPEYLIKIGHSINTTDFLIDLDIAIRL